MRRRKLESADFFRTNFDRKFSNFTIALSAARAFGKTTSNGHWVDIIPQIARKANRKQGDPRREMSGTPLLMDLLQAKYVLPVLPSLPRTEKNL